MEAFRKILNILIIVFLLFAVLVLVNVISTQYLDSTLTNFNTENFYKTIFGIAAAFLLVYLLVSNMSILALRRERTHLNNRINELKASLYDKKETTIRNQTRENRPAEPITPKANPIFPPDNLQ